jgi:uncharacterized protein (DUF1501 family)
MGITRRQILKLTPAALLGAGLVPVPGLRGLLFAAEPAARDRILVVLHLRGGCDGLNLLSPAGDPQFVAARNSDLRVPDDGADAGHPVPHAAAGAGEFRLHAGASALAEICAAKQLAFIHAAGLTDTTRSHFVATDMIERGVADEAALNRATSGWLTRALAATPGGGLVRAVSTSGAPSGAWSGSDRTLSIPDLSNGLAPPGGAQTADVLQRLYAQDDAGAPGTGAVSEAGRIALAGMAAVDTRLPRDAHGKVIAYLPESGVSYDAAADFARPLKALAQLIKLDVGLRAATVDLGGWDTHEYQPGRFRNQVERLSQGLGAFYNDMAPVHDRLTVVVLTEFGRRLRSNRSNGTDHGRGSVMMAMGGRVAGGRILGRWPGLGADQLEEGVDLAVVNDYREALTEIVGHWRGAPAAPDLFPGFKPQARLGLYA